MSANQSSYHDRCSYRLSVLETNLRYNGQLNLLHLHVHSEDFYGRFLQKVFGWELKNLNNLNQNVDSIDLISKDNKKIFVQVSSTCTKKKIQDSLNGPELVKHQNFNFKFVSLHEEASRLRKLKYVIPPTIHFDPANDIIDGTSVLRCIKDLPLQEQSDIADFLDAELVPKVDLPKLNSNLTRIIKIISNHDLKEMKNSTSKLDEFSINDKIEKNFLEINQITVRDYAVYSEKLDNIWNAFDAGGQNRSESVLDFLNDLYVQQRLSIQGDHLFKKIVDDLLAILTEDDNCKDIAVEELQVYVKIIVVNAFIKCKIFENPNSL